MATWVALLPAPPGGADAVVEVAQVGGGTAWVALWHADEPPHTGAAVVDPRLVGPGGPAATASWVTTAGGGPLMDDPAVLAARRQCLRSWPPLGMSTLAAPDGVHLAGSVALWPAAAPVGDDPFARLGTAVRVRVPAGVLRALARPTGPVLERYSGAPWPWDRFEGS